MRIFQIAEDHCRTAYNGNSSTDGVDLYMAKFFDYFDWHNNRQSNSNGGSNKPPRQGAIDNERIKRSLIGHQPALGSNNNKNSTLLCPVARPRERGTCDIAGSVEIGEVIANPPPFAPTDGSESGRRRGRNQNFNTPRSTRGQHSFLPHSTSGNTNADRRNVDRMHSGYMGIAQSITTLAAQSRFRRVADINKELVDATLKRAELVTSGAEQNVISIYDSIITDLQTEKTRANEVYEAIVCNLNNTFENNDN